MKEKRKMWYCDVFEKEMNKNTKSKRIISNTHKHGKDYGTNVKNFEIKDPEIDEKDYKHTDVVKDCRENFFLHSVMAMRMKFSL